MSDDAERLYDRARALPPEERAAFLDEACRDDPELRDELLSLLDQAEDAEAFFGLLDDALVAAILSAGDGPPPVGPSLTPGRVVGPYRILERIGTGGMGTVYRARDTRLDRDVALKFLPSSPADGRASERLLVEARAAAALEHHNVCTVHEIGETDDGRPFIAMAFYRGETLKERLRRGPVPAAEAADVTAQLARGLAAAHARGIVHGDVKPGNVMLTADGTVKLLDFGLAEMGDAPLVPSGARRGTLPYMSPEQVRGEPRDARADLWSVGVVLYEMLTGVKPFRAGSDVELLRAILHDDPEPVTTLSPRTPEPLARIAHRLLRKEPGDRYAGAERLLAELAGGAAVADRAARGASTARRRRRLAGMGAAALLLSVTAVALWPWGSGTGPPTGDPDATPPGDRTASVAAYELNARARDQSLFRSDSGVRRAVGYLAKAVALDSTYAAAHANLSIMYLVLSGRDRAGRPTGELLAHARRAASRALSLDDSLADAHAALALVRQYADYDFASAESRLRRAIALAPIRSRFRQWLAQVLLQAGRPRAALAEARRALEVDSLSPTAHAELAHALLANGRHDEALARLERIAELRPPLLRTAHYAAQAYAKKGMWREAIAAIRPQAEEGESRALGLYGYLLGRAGRRGEALRVRATLEERWREGTGSTFDVGIVYAGLGQLDRALRWLDRSVDDRSGMLSNLHLLSPIFEELRREPGFESLRTRLGSDASPPASSVGRAVREREAPTVGRPGRVVAPGNEQPRMPAAHVRQDDVHQVEERPRSLAGPVGGEEERGPVVAGGPVGLRPVVDEGKRLVHGPGRRDPVRVDRRDAASEAPEDDAGPAG